MNRISYFSDAINNIPLPERFTFPFYYEPHPLAKMAAAELQEYLQLHYPDAGKMFGVLVIQDKSGRLGYLSAFSGKLDGTNDHDRFVPPVFDMLIENSFFLQGQEVINTVNARLSSITTSERYLQLKKDLERCSIDSLKEIAALKEQLKVNKANRDQLRKDNIFNEAELVKQSLYDKHLLKTLKDSWQQQLDDVQNQLNQFDAAIEALKNERKERSAALQQQLFDQYLFLNQAGESRSLHDIFLLTPFGKPPSAAGECAMPKLLQFAFLNGYKPVAMAEFWWGASPKSEIRKHKHFYPACTGKCKPILAHMLEGMLVDENPLLLSEKTGTLEIIYEDDSFVVVNKPAGLRSVPGVTIHDSVYTQLKHLFEPLMIHRLDMDTSGLLVVAKTKEIHKHIQRQFLQRSVSKRYTALLSKVIDGVEGTIDLPLAADLLNRPRQIVCFDSGKTSITKWKVITHYDSMTKIDFWPLTGRTHQLRMHSAHELGLNAPIVGDDLYGTAAERMYLHAAYLEFTHPKSKERMKFEIESGF